MICTTEFGVVGFVAIFLGGVILMIQVFGMIRARWVKRVKKLEAAVQAFGQVAILADYREVISPIARIGSALNKITDEQWAMVRKGES